MLPTYDHTGGSGPTLVFLHYWGGSARTWHLATAQADLAGRDTLTIDFRGWGRSGALPGPFTLEQFADDVLAVLDDAGITDYVLVGHSMGGKVAQLVASRQPRGLRGIVLVASGPAKPAPEITPEYQQGLSHAYDSADAVAYARDEILTGSSLPLTEHEAVVVDSLAAASDEARLEWPLHGIATDITAEASRITVPTLVIGASLDRVEPVDVLRSHLLPYLSHASLLEIAGSGHLVPLEAPGPLAAAIEQFAGSLSASVASPGHSRVPTPAPAAD